MKNRRLMGNCLLLGWLFALSGCGLFRNTSKHRESIHTENQRSERWLRDSTTYRTTDSAGFSVSITHGHTETGIGFVAEGNAVIHPDGTVSAGQVRGMVSHMGATASTTAVESQQQRQTLDVVSETNETQQSESVEKDTADRKSRTNWIVFIVLVVIGALLWRVGSKISHRLATALVLKLGVNRYIETRKTPDSFISSNGNSEK